MIKFGSIIEIVGFQSGMPALFDNSATLHNNLKGDSNKMATEIITTKDGKDAESRKVSVEFDFGNDLEDAVSKFGAEAVFAGFKADATVGLQAFVRSRMKATEEDSEELKYTDEEIVAAVAEWKPGVKTRKSADPLEKLKALLDKLPAEARAALLEQALS